MLCHHCEELKTTLYEIEQNIEKHSNNLYSQEQRDDLLHDFKSSKNGILLWKSHIIRSVNQESAKQELLQNFDDESALIVIDWAMKFVQTKYREKQSDWFGKRGLSWHISSVVTRDQETQQIKVLSYAHLFDSCSQDWYAVASILENLLRNINVNFPSVKEVYLRSDEAGCYHNNHLIAAARDIGDRVGITVVRYDFSEPQQGKDICDRVLCPMKGAIRKYCAEGHDIINVSNMREALKERPIKGTTAAVSILNDSKKNLQINKITRFSELHNFRYENSGLRVWKAYAVGIGKLIPWQSLYVRHQGPTNLSLNEGQGFFESTQMRKLPIKKHHEENDENEEEAHLFLCPEAGCTDTFDSFSELELHIDVGVHEIPDAKVSFYDTIRRDWAEKFSSVDVSHVSTVQVPMSSAVRQGTSSHLSTGWALAKPKTGGVRFSKKVRMYLTTKFGIGERTGRKADPDEVALNMRNARNEKNERLFLREEWLTKTQVAGFFSRLASRQKSRGQEALPTDEELQSEEGDRQDIECLIRASDRYTLMNDIDNEIGLKHPITFDAFDLCDQYKRRKIEVFNVAMLKAILSHFEITYRAKDRKKDLIRLLEEVLQHCPCCNDESQ